MGVKGGGRKKDQEKKSDDEIDEINILLSDDDDDENEAVIGIKNPLFNTLQLQKYLLICCQHFQGGITDKPPKASDYYHTCYGLSGLSVAQHYDGKLLGPSTNKLEAIDAVYGIEESKLVDAW